MSKEPDKSMHRCADHATRARTPLAASGPFATSRADLHSVVTPPYGTAARGSAPTCNPVRPLRLIRNATVITLDDAVGEMPRADILIDGERIAAVGPDLTAAEAEIIDAADMVALPGFIDTHRHMWQGVVRHVFPDATLAEYFNNVLRALGPRYRSEDVYIGNLVSALSAIDAGVTTILDWSHIQNSPQHTDAAIAALRDSGMRAVFAYGQSRLAVEPRGKDRNHRYLDEVKRLRSRYFSSDDQLLTLAIAASGPSFSPVEDAVLEWQAARDNAARISVHLGLTPETRDRMHAMHRAGLLQSDTTYIHCTNMSDEVWQIIADTGGTVSLSASVEMQMGHGSPAVQQALDHGIRPSLSVDVETSAPNDLFTQMRTVFAAQRASVHERILAGGLRAPSTVTVRDMLDFAIVQGARANGLGHRTGALTPGKQADVILLRKDRVNVLPLRDAVGAVVLGMDTGNVDSVFVAGKALKRDGKLVGVDLRAIAARAVASQEYVLSGAAPLS